MAVCMECGRKLKSSQSKLTGYGPICYKRVFGTAMRARDGNSKSSTSIDDIPYYDIPGKCRLKIFWITKDKGECFRNPPNRQLNYIIIRYGFEIKRRATAWIIRISRTKKK